jgi:hypothetical protein
MQMIEYMEESVLGSCFSRKFLNIVNNQYFNGLVEIHKVVDRIISHCIGVLNLKRIGRHIKHPFIGMHLFGFYANGIGQVSFSHTRFSVNEKWIESCFSRFGSNGDACRTSQFIAFPFYQCIKIVFQIQLRIDIGQ